METLKTIPIAAPRLGEEERQAVLAVLDSGQLAQGPVVEAFEREFAAWCGAKHAIAVNSGTAALHLLMLAHGVKEDVQRQLPQIVEMTIHVEPAWALSGGRPAPSP